MSAQPTIWVELFGMPRLLAGRRDVELAWQPGLTLADVPAQLLAACPSLGGQVVDASGALAPGFVVNLNGRDFIRDPATPIRPHDRLLLLAADAGG